MANFVLIDKKSLNEISVDTSNINLTAPSSVHTKLYRNEVSEFIQDGNNLILKLKNGKTIVVKNFFIVKGELESELVFEDTTGMPWLPYLLGGAAAAGAIAALASDSDGDNTTKNTPPSVVAGKEKQPTITGENKPKTGNITDVKDPDGDQLTYKVTTQPKNGTVTIDAKTGEYTYTPNKGFNGEDTFTVTVDDGKGGTTTIEVPVSVIPAAEVEVTGYEDNVGNAPENIASGESTNDNKPTITGIAKNVTDVIVTIGGKEFGPLSVDKDGKWIVPESDFDTELADGEYVILVTGKDIAGNKVESDYTVTIDTVAPQVEVTIGEDGTITLKYPDDVDPDTVKTDGITVTGPKGPITVDFGTPSIDGNGNVIVTGKVPGGNPGNVTVTVPEGSYEDAAGNKGGETTGTGIIVPAPDATVKITGYEDNVGNDPENVAHKGFTNDANPVIKGTSSNATKVTVTIYDEYDDIVATVTVGVNKDGTWETPELSETLEDGKYKIKAIAENDDGKESSPSNTYGVTVDTKAPSMDIMMGTGGNIQLQFNKEIDSSLIDWTKVIVKDPEGKLLNLKFDYKDGNARIHEALLPPNTYGKFTIEVLDGAYTDKVGNIGKGKSTYFEIQDPNAPKAFAAQMDTMDELGTESMDEEVTPTVASNDTVLYTLLSGLEADANGHSVETWDNFVMGNSDDNNDADSIKFSEDFFTGLTMEDLLSDDSSTVGKFITVDYDAESQTATISVDRDGEGSGYINETLLHLTNQDTAITLDDLLANHQIVIG